MLISGFDSMMKFKFSIRNWNTFWCYTIW